MAALQGLHADVFITSTPSVNVTANTVYNDISANVGGSGAANEYPALSCWASSIAAQRYLDPTVAPVIQTSPDGVTWTTVAPDHIEPGFVRWDTTRPAHVRISSGKYLPYAHMAGSNEWTLSPKMNMVDVTEFGLLSKTYFTTIQEASVSVKKFWVDHTLTDLLVAGTVLILVLYVNAAGQPAGPRYECFAFIKDDSIKAASSDVIRDSLNFQVQAASGATNSVWFLNN